MGKARGGGSIVQLDSGKSRARCRRWRIVISMGRDPITKKRLPPRTKRVCGTYTEAQAALREFLIEVENGPDGGGERMAALVQDWIESREMLVQSGALAAGTCRKDKVRAKTISAWFGQAKVADVGPDDVMRFYAAMRTGSSSLSGEPLSGTTARGIAVALSAVMDMAVKRRIILENPCSGVDKPKVDTDEKQALSVETLRSLMVELAGGEPEARKIGVLLAVTCGLSREELLGLSWRDVSDEVLSISKVRNVDDPGLANTKTKHRKRSMPIHPKVQECLAAWRAVQRAKLKRLRIVQDASTPVVTNSVGGRMHPENFARWWRSWRDEHGLDGVGLLELRHTFATYVVSKGTDMITAADLMGHSGTQMLENVYAHTVPENKVSAMKAVGDFMFGLDD